jgi:hypothetical protein
MNTNEKLKQQMLDLFEGQTKFCPHCKNLRIEVTIDQLPKEAIELKRILINGLKILYCKHCKTFSVLSPAVFSL